MFVYCCSMNRVGRVINIFINNFISLTHTTASHNNAKIGLVTVQDTCGMCIVCLVYVYSTWRMTVGASSVLPTRLDQPKGPPLSLRTYNNVGVVCV